MDCPKLQAEQPEDVAPLNDDRQKNASDTQYRGAEPQQLEQEHLHTLSLAETVLEQVQPGIHWRDKFVHRRSMIAACIPHIIAVGIGLSSVVIVARVARTFTPERTINWLLSSITAFLFKGIVKDPLLMGVKSSVNRLYRTWKDRNAIRAVADGEVDAITAVVLQRRVSTRLLNRFPKHARAGTTVEQQPRSQSCANAR